MRRLFLLAALVTAPLVPAVHADDTAHADDAGRGAPKFRWPLACVLGRTCWIQHYVDRDPLGPARDYTCGSLTYHGHNGTDIRLADMAAERAGVDVLAAADGRVLRARDGVPDISVRIRGLDTVKDQECGNGMVVAHSGGWETQYCHMAKGSLVVKPGDRVKAGQPLGHVGLSGETEFAHLHITFRHDGVMIDPFAPDAGAPDAGTPDANAVGQGAAKRCGGGRSVWADTPAYTPRAVINAGFAPGPVDMAAIEAGGIARPGATAPYLVAYVRTIGLRAGDQPSFTLSAPDGAVLADSPPSSLPTDRDQAFLLIGKRLRAPAWPKGLYRARYTVTVGGRPVLERDFAIELGN